MKKELNTGNAIPRERGISNNEVKKTLVAERSGGSFFLWDGCDFGDGWGNCLNR